MKARFRSVPVAVGGSDYAVIVRAFPARKMPHVSADSPRFMDTGAKARVQVIRILRAAVDVTDELTPFTRSKIEEAVKDRVK